MSIVAVVLCVAVDVAVSQNIQLLLATTTSGIDWEKDGPSDAAADQADGSDHAQVAKEEVRVERLVLKSVNIGYLPEILDPAE